MCGPVIDKLYLLLCRAKGSCTQRCTFIYGKARCRGWMFSFRSHTYFKPVIVPCASVLPWAWCNEHDLLCHLLWPCLSRLCGRLSGTQVGTYTLHSLFGMHCRLLCCKYARGIIERCNIVASYWFPSIIQHLPVIVGCLLKKTRGSLPNHIAGFYTRLHECMH